MVLSSSRSCEIAELKKMTEVCRKIKRKAPGSEVGKAPAFNEGHEGVNWAWD